MTENTAQENPANVVNGKHRGIAYQYSETDAAQALELGLDIKQALIERIDQYLDETYDFGAALHGVVNVGETWRRKSWAEGAFIYLVKGSKFNVNRPPLSDLFKDGREIEYGAHIDMFTSDNKAQVWQPTQDAILADDWQVYVIPDEE